MLKLIKQILMERLAAEKHKTLKMEWEKAKLQTAIDNARKNSNIKK